MDAAGAARRGARVAGVAAEIGQSSDLGRVDPDLPVERMVLVLPVRDAAGLEKVLAELQDPASSRFRRWLTPSEFGERFGARREDLEALAAWLRSEGFVVEGATAGRTALVFSGRAADVERAFDTELHVYVKEGRRTVGNARPMTLPSGLGGVPVRGLLPVNGFMRRSPLVREAGPLFNGSQGPGLSPADFATLYGLDGVYPSARGAGQKIAIVARTNISLTDARLFRAYFGLPPKDPVVVLNGDDPGILLGDLALLETNLDIEWAGGLAPEADVLVVVSKSTATTDGIDLSSLYAIDQNLAGIVSVSYGACEPKLAPEEVAFFSNLWSQAAAQGISVIVSAGDSGAAGCDSFAASRGTIQAVNGLGSSPYATTVGGTQFDDGGNPDLYWAITNDPATRRTALGPIPEVAWNESAKVPGGSGLLAGGGGASILYGRPAWQSIPGAPAGTQRLVPDIAVNAGGRVPYYLVSLGSLFPVYGTSASAPAFAGIAALLQEVAGGELGSLNPSLYALGLRQYADGTASVFRDVTSGSNSVPGVTGWNAGPGYDAVTGLGSPDGAALADALRVVIQPAPTADFTFPAGPRAGQPVQFTDASTGSPTSWLWHFGDGGTSTAPNPSHTFGTGTYPVSLTVSNASGSSTRTENVVVSWDSPVACAPDPHTMCLVKGRYRVTSHWRNQYAGGAEAALSKTQLTDATGAFWKSETSAFENLIRFDTATDNGRAWISIPMFTDVEFWIAVFDTLTGRYKEYHSPAGNRTLIYDPDFFVYP
jgi:pseudomonalisin